MKSYRGTLHVEEVLGQKNLLVLGGTGFLGKLFWVMLLCHYPNVGRIYLVVRTKSGLDPKARFEQEIATSEALRPLREAHGDRFSAFLSEKVIPIGGDTGEDFAGLSTEWIARHRGSIHAVVNIAGVVDFNPPLDDALAANAYGAMNVVNLARALGDIPLFHTSTCYVAGRRAGPILEESPCNVPFPRAPELGTHLWDPETEIRECQDLIREAVHRANDAFRLSDFEKTARENLLSRHEPTSGEPLALEIAEVRRRFIQDRLIAAGRDRAVHWGWPNIYTYTKSLGEQIVARSGLPFVIARPACCETTLSFPFEGWNEGVSTSSPILYLILKGEFQIPAGEVPLDLIPSDWVTAGMIVSLAELLEGTHAPVYQYGTSADNPATVRRFAELCGLYKRTHYKKVRGNAVLNFLKGRMEPLAVSRERFHKTGAPALALASAKLAEAVEQAPALVPLAKSLRAFAKTERKIGQILTEYLPFMVDLNGPFSTAETRRAFRRLSEADRAKLHFAPETLDWAHYFHRVHLPGIERWVVPEIERRMMKEVKPRRAHRTLTTLLSELCERHPKRVALSEIHRDGLSRVTYEDLYQKAKGVASRLSEMGVRAGDRVLLAGENHPAWAVAYFGILWAGATAVPMDPTYEREPAERVLASSQARAAILDARRQTIWGLSIPTLLLEEVLELPAQDFKPYETHEDTVASILYTSGTTGTPKGVMLTHDNFVQVVASLSPLFSLGHQDRVLSVLPLHHTFEFTCGLLLPLSQGARVVYLGEVTSERFTRALRLTRPTALVGVPAVWKLLERRILSEVQKGSPVTATLFQGLLQTNKTLASSVGLDLGKWFFGRVHETLGGEVRYLISGGAALPEETKTFLESLGLPIAEGYGLTEAAPVLTFQRGKRRTKGVGTAIPGVQLRIADPNEQGIGEVLARGPNVMKGYTDPSETEKTFTADGWLRTGDLGHLSTKGELSLLGRQKETIVTATGENIYPEDLENRLGSIAHVAEYAFAAVRAASGEILGCLAVVAPNEARGRAEKAFADAVSALPKASRPSVLHFTDAPLPRTSTRKVQRARVAELLETAETSHVEAGTLPPDPDTLTRCMASVLGKLPRDFGPASRLTADLGFDSLTIADLAAKLETEVGFLDGKALLRCETVRDVHALLQKDARRPSAPHSTPATLHLPRELQEAGRWVAASLQDTFYGRALEVKVTGRANIPSNRQTIIVANHASHLDMGLVRHALGKYGEHIVTLAAQDYFFDRGTFTRTLVENFTNLRPLDRQAGLRHGERQALDILEKGHLLLLFPEGTRSVDGAVGTFKPFLGHLSLARNIDILPVYVGGTHRALPKGTAFLRSRSVFARIGPALSVRELRRLTDGMNHAEASRHVAHLAREAVLSLSRGGALDLSSLQKGQNIEVKHGQSLPDVFDELKARFRPGRADKPVSYYLTLGGGPDKKWTVSVDPHSCNVHMGKPAGGNADCVLKTSPEIFAKIVRESFVPGPEDFLSGAFLSNDVSLLFTFQQVFDLGSAG